MPGGQPLSAEAAKNAGIQVRGVTLTPVPHSQPIRYLGAHLRFDGNWSTQRSKALATIHMFTRMVTKFSLSVGHAVYVFRVFLLPKLEIALHYCTGLGTAEWIKHCDRALISCVAHTAGSLLSLSNSAVASALGMTLPSWLEAATKVSELFVRANTPDHDRWAILGRAQLMQAAPVSMSAETISNRGANSSHGGGLTRTLHLAVHKLGWKLTQLCDTVRHKQRLLLKGPEL
jgi:hypothetical protein